MYGRWRRPLLGGAALVGAAAALAALTATPPARSAPVPACGAATVATLAGADATVLGDIYRNELAGEEVAADTGHVTNAADLLHAVASGDRAATLRAVTRLVFHRHWHIVRLRALDRSGQVLADIGGPYVIAPVAGVLRSGGRVVGSFVMSVQDDVGVTKLETRFVGDPIGIYVGGRRVASMGASFPLVAPSGSSMTVGTVRYATVWTTFRAFPSGTLRVVLLVAPPPARLAAQPCGAVRAGELARVAARLARLAPSLSSHYRAYALTVHLFTGAEVFVRSGPVQLASSDGPGPPALPAGGTVSYQGQNWQVASFEPSPSARVYVLTR